MTPRPPLVDIHCHPLPAVDDGAQDWDESLGMARLAADDGVGTIIATPHQLGAYPGTRGKQIADLTAEMQARVLQAGIRLRVLPGAEIRIEPGVLGKLRQRDLLSLADHQKHVLLELPSDVYLPIERTISDLAAAGLTVVLAHPERNRGIRMKAELIQELVQRGCLMQITAASLTGTFGPDSQQIASRWIQQGLVHFVASDGHGLKTRRPLLSKAFDYVAQLAGVEVAIDLCCRNPASVAAGQPLPAARPAAPRMTSGGWFGWKKTG